MLKLGSICRSMYIGMYKSVQIYGCSEIICTVTFIVYKIVILSWLMA